MANPQFTPSQINCPERVTVRRKFIPKVQNLERVPIAKKRPAMKVVNGASPAISVFGKNKQVPVNLLVIFLIVLVYKICVKKYKHFIAK